MCFGVVVDGADSTNIWGHTSQCIEEGVKNNYHVSCRSLLHQTTAADVDIEEPSLNDVPFFQDTSEMSK